MLEEAEFAFFRGALGGGLVDLVGVVADDLAELDASEEVLVGLGDLAEDGVGPHVLDVGFDEGSALLDGLDDLLFAHDGLIDEGVLPGGQLARGQDVLLRLFLAEEAWLPKAGSAVAMRAASSRPAVECFRKIMILGSCGDPSGHPCCSLMLVQKRVTG